MAARGRMPASLDKPHGNILQGPLAGGRLGNVPGRMEIGAEI